MIEDRPELSHELHSRLFLNILVSGTKDVLQTLFCTFREHRVHLVGVLELSDESHELQLVTFLQLSQKSSFFLIF